MNRQLVNGTTGEELDDSTGAEGVVEGEGGGEHNREGIV